MVQTHWKRRSGPDAGRFLATEAAGLDWIRVPGGPPIPAIVSRESDSLGIERVAETRPGTAAAAEFGADVVVGIGHGGLLALDGLGHPRFRGVAGRR